MQTRDGGRRWSVLVLPTLTFAALVLTVALDVATPASGPGVELAPGDGWPYALLGVVFAGSAAAVLWHDARQGTGWALAWVGAFWAQDGLAQAYVRFGIRADDVLPGENLALWTLNRLGAFLPMAVAALLLLFPTGRLMSGAWGRIGIAVLVFMGASSLLVVLAPAGERAPDVRVPAGVDFDFLAVPLPEALVDAAVPFVVVCSVAGLLLAMVAVVVRYRGAQGVERERMRWLAWSVVVVGLVLMVAVATDLAPLQLVSLFLIATVPAVTMAIGIVRPDLVSIDDLLTRTVVTFLLTVGLLVLDLGVVTALSRILGERLAEREVITMVLLVTAVLYGPLRMRIATLVRRFTLGAAADPYDVVAGLASSLERVDEGPEQLAAVAGAVARAFGVAYVEVEVERGGGEHLTATYGVAPPAVRDLPIDYRGERVGLIRLPARGLRSRLSRRDERLLGDLVRQAATAARTGRLAEELQLSRERLVVAREEERRRIRRDLHDGLGPALSGIVFQLESARLLVDRDPETAKSGIAGTSALVQDVVADVRRLVHDLRPPALDDRGLVGAISQQAERMSTPTRVTAGELGVLPAAAEVAAYRIAAEALANVERHATATRCDVRFAVDDGRLVVEIVDDGVGIATDRQAGVGLFSLRERAGELGGRADVTCPADGGTVVRAVLPLTARSTGRPSKES